MRFWLSFIGYHVVWFAAVMGAGDGLAWPAMVTLVLYAAVQLRFTRNVRLDLALAATALVLGFLIDGGLIRTGLGSYSAPWPSPNFAPAWILSLWAGFAMTFTQSLTWFQNRLWLAALFGLVGGPLAYYCAALSWQVVQFSTPSWQGLLWLGVCWSLATPLLAWMARRGTMRVPVAGAFCEEQTR